MQYSPKYCLQPYPTFVHIVLYNRLLKCIWLSLSALIWGHGQPIIANWSPKNPVNTLQSKVLIATVYDYMYQMYSFYHTVLYLASYHLQCIFVENQLVFIKYLQWFNPSGPPRVGSLEPFLRASRATCVRHCAHNTITSHSLKKRRYLVRGFP